MAISSESGGFSKSKYMILQFTVKDISLEYNKQNNGKTTDISLEVSVERVKKDGLVQDSKLYVGGNYKKDGNGVVGAWGSAFKIKEFILACVPGLKFSADDQGKIADDIFQQCIDKEIFVLKYLSTKDNGEETYRTYNIFSDDMMKLEKKFLKDVERSMVYKYSPELASDDTSFKPFPENDTSEPVI